MLQKGEGVTNTVPFLKHRSEFVTPHTEIYIKKYQSKAPVKPGVQ